jgi:hypothetical protein
MVPGRNSRVRAVLLHESERTRATRLFLPGRTVVRRSRSARAPTAACGTGSRCSVRTVPGSGTTLQAELPLAPPRSLADR